MQSLCDQVRERIGPLPLAVKRTPHSYMPFLHEMLKVFKRCFQEGRDYLLEIEKWVLDNNNNNNYNKIIHEGSGGL